jgi:hypothetical protein
MRLSKTCWFGCFAALLMTLSAEAQNQDVEPLGTVSIHVIDENGRTIEDCRVDRFVDRHNVEVATHFRGLDGTKVPYGLYTYVIKLNTSGREAVINGRVSVWLPDNFVVVPVTSAKLAGAAVDRAIPFGFSIRGKIESVPPSTTSSSPLWIRLVPIYGTDRLDVAVDQSGEFRIFAPLVGRYLLIVIRGDEVLDVKQVSFNVGEQLEDLIIKLPSRAPEVFQVRKK